MRTFKHKLINWWNENLFEWNQLICFCEKERACKPAAHSLLFFSFPLSSSEWADGRKERRSEGLCRQRSATSSLFLHQPSTTTNSIKSKKFDLFDWFGWLMKCWLKKRERLLRHGLRELVDFDWMEWRDERQPHSIKQINSIPFTNQSLPIQFSIYFMALNEINGIEWFLLWIMKQRDGMNEESWDENL